MTRFERAYDETTRLLLQVDEGQTSLTAAITICSQKTKNQGDGEVVSLWEEIRDALVQQWQWENTAL
jgi:hypothetical protein